MTDIRADELDEGERLPWLEAVEEDEAKEAPSILKLIVAVLIGLAAIGGIVGGIFWLGNRDGSRTAAGSPELIRAPAADYKAKPTTPGGMQVEGEGDSSYAASAGADTKGNIDTSAVPETPVVRPPPAPKSTAKPAAKPAPVETAKIVAAKPKPAPAAAAPAPAAGGPGIQLGAFSSNTQAEGAWKTMSARFKYLSPLNHSVASANVGGKTYYRLRAYGPDSKGLCARLRVAGENCVA
ncbi:MAG: hypothetical protein JWO25_2456, partial [Alphaproteobacteria bacterium]|nr:hypothetical protein [Alphaproteobacteria bacterium]